MLFRSQNELNFETEFLDTQRLKKEYGIDALGGLLSKNDVELNPMAFVSAMATRATKILVCLSRNKLK